LWLALFVAAPMVVAQQRSFVACPIVRDTKTVPCYLAEYDGELYFLGIQQDITSEFHPPQLKHEVLVEGRVAEGPRVCGGIPLKPLAISVMKEVNLSCNTLLPAEPGIEAPPAERGAGPSSRRAAPVRVAAVPISGPHEFDVPYAFDDDYLEFGANRVVSEAVAYAKRTNAANVKVTGYRATTLLSNGNKMIEKPGLAEQRAQNVATVLRGQGVANISVDWQSEAQAADGSNDAAKRRVSILITP
jgi:outer membrane protein OmpA-like peptidoglycan-associated protein